jgi:hypothetical protein
MILLPLVMATSHPNMFQQSIVDEGKILKLIESHFVPNHMVPQWRSLPNSKEIVVFSAFF